MTNWPEFAQLLLDGSEEATNELRRRIFDPIYYKEHTVEDVVKASQVLDDVIGLPREVLDQVESYRKRHTPVDTP